MKKIPIETVEKLYEASLWVYLVSIVVAYVAALIAVLIVIF